MCLYAPPPAAMNMSQRNRRQWLLTAELVWAQLEVRAQALAESRDAQDEEVARLAGRIAVLESELRQTAGGSPTAPQPPAMPGPGSAKALLMLSEHLKRCSSCTRSTELGSYSL